MTSLHAILGRDLINLLAVLVVWIFHGVLGGVFTPPTPSNSAPELRSDMRQAAFESSSKITKKVLGHFEGQVKGQVTRGHQSQNVPDFLPFRHFSTSDALAREPEELERRRKKANDSPFTALPGMCRQI